MPTIRTRWTPSGCSSVASPTDSGWSPTSRLFQEILHRYVAIKRRDAISAAFESLSAIVDEVFAISFADVSRAREIVLATGDLSARDALHLAMMEHHDVETILTFDRGFDDRPGVRRLT